MPLEAFVPPGPPEPPPLTGSPNSSAVEHPVFETHPLLAPIDDARRPLPLRADGGVTPELELRTLGP